LAFPRSSFGSALFDVSCQPITDFGEFTRAEAGLQNTHDFEHLGFRWAKCPEEAEFFNPTDSRVDSSDIANLVVGLSNELSHELPELLACAYEPRRLSRCGIEAGKFLAQTDEQYCRGVSERLPPSDSRDALAAFDLDLSEEGISFRLVDDKFLANLTEIVRDAITLRTKRFPCRTVLAIYRFKEQASEN
jgi:hypothetical protein